VRELPRAAELDYWPRGGRYGLIGLCGYPEFNNQPAVTFTIVDTAFRREYRTEQPVCLQPRPSRRRPHPRHLVLRAELIAEVDALNKADREYDKRERRKAKAAAA
jgi:hypothetical protein